MRNKLYLIIIFLLLSLKAFAGVDFNNEKADFIRVGNTGFPTGYPCTIYAWVKPSGFSTGASHIYFNFSKRSDASNALQLGTVNTAGTSNVFTWARNSTGLATSRALGTTSVNSMADAVVIGVLDATHNTVYLNGVQDGQDTTGSASWDAGKDTANIGVFSRNNADATDFADGEIIEVAIWDVDLNADEIALLSNSKTKRLALQIRPSNLKGYWALDEGEQDGVITGTDKFKDLSGNANHGTATDANSNSLVKSETILTY